MKRSVETTEDFKARIAAIIGDKPEHVAGARRGQKRVELEIAHVLFTDIGGYLKQRIDLRFQKLCEEKSK